MTRLISMWSGPRNVSTAMMYAWRQRSDTTVVDEPMYGHYLVHTGVDHPGRDLVLASVPTDADETVAGMLRQEPEVPVRFFKNMAHHLEGFSLDLLDQLDNFLLTRDPRDMLPSLAKGLGRVPELRDTGFATQVEIVDRVLAAGRRPIVVDSRVLLDHPGPVLEQLCTALDLPFESAMLSWPPGPKPEDGVWAPYWYDRLHETTGFEPYRPKDEAFPTELEPLYEQSAPLFARLSEFAIGVG
jgi:hypothetical protein